MVNQVIGQCVAALVQLDRRQAAQVIDKLATLFGGVRQESDVSRTALPKSKTKKRERAMVRRMLVNESRLDSSLKASDISIDVVEAMASGSLKRIANAARWIARQRGAPLQPGGRDRDHPHGGVQLLHLRRPAGHRALG